MVKGLQVSNANGVAIPANWPQNELVGDEVIIPPATDEKSHPVVISIFFPLRLSHFS